MKKTLSMIVLLALVLAARLSLAEPNCIRPLEFTQDSFDPDNGEFWFGMDSAGRNSTDLLVMALYLEDRYSLSEIENLKPGDIIEVRGNTFTVETVVIHGWYDSDGDGNPDAGGIVLKDPDPDKCKILISGHELVPESYEIYTQEEFDGYIAFTVGSDGYCHPLVNDETFRTQVGTVEIPLPLPENFVYHYEENWEEMEGTVQDFLDSFDRCNPYSSVARLENGKLVEVRCFE